MMHYWQHTWSSYRCFGLSSSPGIYRKEAADFTPINGTVVSKSNHISWMSCCQLNHHRSLHVIYLGPAVILAKEMNEASFNRVTAKQQNRGVASSMGMLANRCLHLLVAQDKKQQRREMSPKAGNEKLRLWPSRAFSSQPMRNRNELLTDSKNYVLGSRVCFDCDHLTVQTMIRFRGHGAPRMSKQMLLSGKHRTISLAMFARTAKI